MKKLLLFCFVLLSITSFAQLIQLVVSNQIQCNGNNTFNLTSMNAIILAQNPTISSNGTFFNYYLTASDAMNASNNFIANPTNFISSVSPQTIFVRTGNVLPGSNGIGSFNLIVDTPIVVNAILTANATCAGLNEASIAANVSGGTAPYAYSLSTANGLLVSGPSSSGTFTNLPAGVYIITVTDTLGCTSTSNVVIIINPSPVVCLAVANGNTVTVNASGGSPPYSYSIINGGSVFQASNIFTNLAVGTVYTFQVRDSNGCSCFSQAEIPFNGFALNVTSSLDIPVSTFFANASGGVAPYSYQWSYNGVAIAGANTSSVATQQLCGQFSVAVTDTNGLFSTANAPNVCQSIIANNDAITVYQSNIATTTSTISVLGNDFLGNNQVNSPNTNVILTPINVPVGFNINSNGTVSVLSGTASGSYTLQYQICQISNSNSNNCATGTVTITIPANGIVLKAFIDSDGNGIQNNGEVNFTQGQFGYQLNNGTVNNISTSSGEFFIAESNTSNSYNLSYAINAAVATQYSLTTSSYSNISASGVGVSVFNFPVTQLPFTDLAVYNFQYGPPPRPGFTYLNRIQYSNNGNQLILSGTLTFTNNSVVTITNISQTGTSNNASGFTYNFTNLLPNESRFIDVTMQVPVIPTVSLGQILTNAVSVSIPNGDVNVSNNSATLSQIIVGSYDPNDKVESHGGKILHATFTSNDYLNYTIQFENTGTYNAENVRINDVLDAKLDETSIKMVNASHSYILNRVGRNLNWNFNGIELPPNGKGSVTFQIKPKVGYALGDVIPNTASIFFDFNPPIITNTFNTQFVAALGIPEFENQDFTVFPNPTNSVIYVSLKNNLTIDSVSIYDVLGKMVINQKVNNFSTDVDLSKITNGIYFLKIASDSKVKTIKIIKN